MDVSDRPNANAERLLAQIRVDGGFWATKNKYVNHFAIVSIEVE
jgi:hypothetical protein